MTFKEWYLRSNKTQRQIARDLGVGHEWISRIITGARTPGLKLMIKITAYTNGEVTFEELNPTAFRLAAPYKVYKPNLTYEYK